METEQLISVIIPTIGRDSLVRAVESVLEQVIPSASLNVVVVNDSGLSLRAADRQSSTQVSIVTTSRREPSVARNRRAAVTYKVARACDGSEPLS